MSDQRYRLRFLDCSNMSLQEAENWGHVFCNTQRNIMFYLGDLARYAESQWPDTWQQVFPEWASPGLIARAAGVCRAYPNEEDRQHDATYSQYMQVAGKPDRQNILAGFVDKGLTTDESRRVDTKQWLLAIDVNYYLHKFWFSGAGVEAAAGVADWIHRTAQRLQEKGLTDVACCFDSTTNHRKELTADWDDRYKDRPKKDTELVQQLVMVRNLIEGHGYACVSVEGMEADDCMASLAKQFPGRVTILTQDKDCRQCLSAKCNMLLDVEWAMDATSGENRPVYNWLSAKQHTEETGITPEQWPDYQTIMGDATDGVRGVEGIGQKGAADLIKEFGTVEAAIQAAKDEDERIRPKKRDALIAFESKLETTRQLVTLRDDLPISVATKITAERNAGK